MPRRTFQFIDPYEMLQIRRSILPLSHAAVYQRYSEDPLEIRWVTNEAEARKWLTWRGPADAHLWRVVPVECASTSYQEGGTGGQRSTSLDSRNADLSSGESSSRSRAWMEAANRSRSQQQALRTQSEKPTSSDSQMRSWIAGQELPDEPDDE